MTAPHPPPGDTTPTGRPRRRWWPASTSRRSVLLGALAVLLLVGGWVTWMVVDQAAHSTTIPSSFDGSWTGEGRVWDGVAQFTAELGEGLHVGRLASGASSCYNGPLTVSDATDSQLTTRFVSDNPECNPWTVVFTHISGGDLRMAVDPDSNVNYQSEFEVRLARQG